MIKVPYGQDPYSVIGKYIQDHITAIEDIIAVIEIDDITTNQLFMVDMNEENYFIWENDWYEGEKDIALIDFFPVSEAINPSAERRGRWVHYEHREPQYDIEGYKTWAEEYQCSNCGFIHTVIEDFGHYAFCPRCGARMEV